MKKYLIIILCTLRSIHAAEQSNIPVQKWDASAYDQGNFIQEKAFLGFLNKHAIDFTNEVILDVGCGTGNITNKISVHAAFVDGLDPDKSMIDFSINKYKTNPKVTFHQSSAETFISNKLYDTAIGSFSFNWFYNKPLALKNIHALLKPKGRFFFTAHTSEDPKALNHLVAEEIMASPLVSGIQSIINFFSANPSAAFGSSYPTRKELNNMLINAGFEVITHQQESWNIILDNRENLETVHRPIVMSRPIVQNIPEILREPLFTVFIDKIIERIKKTGDGKFIEEFTTTIILAEKK